MKILARQLKIDLPNNKSAFLWGPRKVGKTHWLKARYPDTILIDLLKTDVLAEYISKPSLLRERYSHLNQLIIIDEVQMAPDILNEVHWLIENSALSFLLTGSSARKLRQKHANLLGGRAWRYTMTPLCYPEIANIDIQTIMKTGLLPSHLTSLDPTQELRAYVADYLKEEIINEAKIQNIPAFSEFLRVAALTSGELINYANIARDCGVSAKTVQAYFQILEDTLLGFRLKPWRKKTTRRLIETEKFYLFDLGITHYLARRTPLMGTPEFGHAFEHYILMELMAYKAYRDPELPIAYWRTSTGLEVDFILGEMEIAIEVKSSTRIHETDLKALSVLQAEYQVKKCFMISFESEPKKIGNVDCLPWELFLQKLWNQAL